MCRVSMRGICSSTSKGATGSDPERWGSEISPVLRRGTPRYQTAPTLLVAPYYGAEQSGTRGGFTPEFVNRIRHCDHLQYLWYGLPIGML